ncbi:c-type cytochrome [Marinimicrococcus flavescens]|uniref:Cytochrome c n=1 Tax=Marinimicrococcus flavescens TaxID=3031815 RepID=A0AAP4D640_9PROT|nr:cytochrome c [Marinimicrococcus flavescens]
MQGTNHRVRQRVATLLLALPLAVQATALPAAASGRPEQPDPAQGQRLAEQYCGRCHATGPTDESPLPEAVPFRELRSLYPLESLAEALAEGIVTGHEAMPVFRFEPRDIDNLLAWLATLDGTRD